MALRASIVNWACFMACIVLFWISDGRLPETIISNADINNFFVKSGDVLNQQVPVHCGIFHERSHIRSCSIAATWAIVGSGSRSFQNMHLRLPVLPAWPNHQQDVSAQRVGADRSYPAGVGRKTWLSTSTISL